MFYYFLYSLKEYSIFFNLFRYITFRAVGASVTAFLLSIILGPPVIKWLSNLSVVNSIARPHAEKIHSFYAAKGTVPTMGGVLIVGSILIANLAWGNLGNLYLLLALLVVVWFGTIGFIDDLLKLKRKNSNGLSSFVKFFGQLTLGLGIGIFLYLDPGFPKLLYVPFFKGIAISLGVFFIPFVIIVLTGSSNALNLTDGLDGLAVGCLSFAAGTFAIFSYLAGRSDFAQYLSIPFVPGSGELTVFCASLVGAGVGFLWYNSYPATVMMGDTGSLALGGALGIVAILIKSELVLLIVGGIFVWEALSVMIQVFSFRVFGKRVFLMSPYHHHLQLKGLSESKVTVRLWIVAFILALIGLSTLKLR
ncbi:MAG: phospho-N-acetylmuramoyl-pentapeptide-transferase [Omnitrophica bacterium RIFCSPHIGHO2_02_FULL_46_11]|nr:MAG: phospho-N-acetylmuramoyl-pentapeptide-transferase [Omnitrophica bacterium RIFCSPHIGHO2_02_FULL_46_11]